MPRFKLTIEYAGTRYSGWQIQNNARTVAGEIERAIREATRRDEFELYGSGRTDAGVHALAQIAHLDLYTDLAPEVLRRRINDQLPADIHIRSAEKAPHKFHARHDAIERAYLYQISARRTAFGKPFVWWVREPLSIEAMRHAARAFVGMQRFDALTADDPDEKSTRVLVDAVEIAEAGALILIRVRGSHFLWKMVRRLVGVLAAVGRGELTAPEAARFLEAGDVAAAKKTAAALAAPAAGLFLEAVRYKGDVPFGDIRPVITIE
ncbi:MAG: tRNA pseudouridine(38-40) synthase TruA [Acidobacteria bacterium]|nr:tRNA pseudouridine(38-40) synthase TruA [Acidobacteriota bacterium]